MPHDDVRVGADETARVARLVRDVLVDAALRAYEDAALSGLCAEGCWEAAVGAMRTVDLDERLATMRRPAHVD